MTPARTSRRRSRLIERAVGRAGYTLIEMLVVVSGTAALITAGATTIVAVRRVATTAQTAAETGTALSRLHRTLRQDAADAVAATADETGLTLATADGGTIVYEAERSAVRRTVTGPRAGGDLFPVGGTGFQWTAEPRPGGVRVALGYDRTDGPDARSDGAAVELAAWLSDDRLSDDRLPRDGGMDE